MCFFLAQCVAEEYQRMVDEHTWAGIAHHLAHCLAHCRGVAVGLALSARRFVLAVRAAVKTVLGIFEQCGAIGAQCRVTVAVTAVEAHHDLDDVLLVVNPRHRHLHKNPNPTARGAARPSGRGFRCRRLGSWSPPPPPGLAARPCALPMPRLGSRRDILVR